MSKRLPLSFLWGIILTNLCIGNGLILLGGLASFEGEPDFRLALGMSAACILVYFSLFGRLSFGRLPYWKSFVLSLLCCMLIVMLGNILSLLLTDPAGLSDNFFAGIVMGVAGNMLFFPVTLVMSGINLLWIRAFRNRINC